MRQKQYEKRSLICICTLCLLGVEMVLIGLFQQTKIIQYQNYQLITLSDKKAILYLPEKEKINWYKNKYFYWNNKKYQYEILEIIKTDSSYLQIKISFSNIKKLKENEVMQVFVEKKRINMVEVIKNTWGGDKNRKSS